MGDVFDLEDLVDVEQQFYDQGYKGGYDHGRIHGLIEGRALGQEKGFEMWEELGFYEGFAEAWKGIYEKIGRGDDRTVHHASHLLELISEFPRINPSPSCQEVAELDISRLMRQIRSRYKALCSTLGVKPSLRASALGGLDEESTGDTAEQMKRTKKPVWNLEDGTKSRGVEQGLSF